MSDNAAPAAAPAPSSGAPSAGSSSTPAAAPTTPSTSGPSSSSTPSTPPAGQAPAAASGEPPRERWDDILNNARRKTRSEVEAEYRERYGRFEQDPWGAVQEWLSAAQQHSVYGPLIKQWGQSAFQQAPSRGEEPKADVPVVDANGNITGYTYSDKKLREWHKWQQAEAQQALDQRLGSIEQQQQAWQQQQEQYAVLRRAHEGAAQTLGELRQRPYFKEHEADIRQALLEHEEWGDNVHAAYNHVLVTKILPTLSQAEAAAVVDSINNKASGSTVSPRGQATGTPKFKNFKEAAEYYEAHPEEAKAAASR